MKENLTKKLRKDIEAARKGGAMSQQQIETRWCVEIEVMLKRTGSFDYQEEKHFSRISAERDAFRQGYAKAGADVEKMVAHFIQICNGGLGLETIKQIADMALKELGK